ncbi:hypothetical protein FS837_012910 [Tulasnella sp. UAMH 9824]|nr:hypothetical protein FS837_012910 [Tulasnella sp. UAMH 9824]
MTTTAPLVYDNPIATDVTRLTPKTLNVKVRFIGELPLELVRAANSMPLQISVSVPPEYAHFTWPVLEVSEQDPFENVEHFTPPITSEVPSFLPLPATFDFTDADSWASVAEAIQDWVTQNPEVKDRDPGLWKMVLNLFWMSYVAVYPDFPRGSWPKWDPRVPLFGAFIEQWIHARPALFSNPITLPYRIWRAFNAIIEKQLPGQPVVNVHSPY